MNQTVNKRLLALDELRGITIAGMIMVNNPGSPWACGMDRLNPDRSGISFLYVYHGYLYLHLIKKV